MKSRRREGAAAVEHEARSDGRKGMAQRTRRKEGCRTRR